MNETGMDFLDMQAQLGVSKHVGGLEATHELLALCHIEDARTVLSIGCGIGVGPVYIAQNYACRVVGTDLSPKMIEWSRQRAREARVDDKVVFVPGDVLHLPFAANHFDIVYAESVFTFVQDKAQAIRECVRVTRPGGYVGLNEGLWLAPPPLELAETIKHAVGSFVLTADNWQNQWDASGLQERVARINHVDASNEMKSRIQWIGWPWLLQAWGRALRLYITTPAIRQSIKATFDVPSQAFQYVGYGLFAGRKPN
jgi:ubiquinone/menaquinone biosynthesis C-methylase UbiE